MTNRIELESALAKAEAIRKKLEAALARERAALADSVASAAANERGREEANARILRARAQCRELQAALAALKNAEVEPRPNPIDMPGKHGAGLTGAATGAGAPPSPPARAPAVRAEQDRWIDAPARRRAPFLSSRNFSVRELDPRAQMILRQAVGFTALVLAFLQYYFLDVELEITRLHPIVTFLFH